MLQRVMSRLSVENLLSHSTKKFRRGTLLCCVSDNFGQRKNLWIKRRKKYQDFGSKIYCLTVPKTFAGEHFRMSLISGIEKFFCLRALFHDFSSNFFCLTVPKHFVEEPFCAVFQIILGSEKIYG